MRLYCAVQFARYCDIIKRRNNTPATVDQKNIENTLCRSPSHLRPCPPRLQRHELLLTSWNQHQTSYRKTLLHCQHSKRIGMDVQCRYSATFHSLHLRQERTRAIDIRSGPYSTALPVSLEWLRCRKRSSSIPLDYTTRAVEPDRQYLQVGGTVSCKRQPTEWRLKFSL